MIATAQDQRRLLGVVFQQRFRAEVLATKRLLEEGCLGQLQHVEAMVSCPRPAAYYRERDWRGTWAGEGGGVLMNQAPHALDLLCYLIGMPGRLVARTQRQLHSIEAEDTVQAMLEWPDGAIGSLAASTAWASGEVAEPASEQCVLHLIGTAGSLRLANGHLSVTHLNKDMRAFASEAFQPFPTGSPCAVPFPFPQSEGTHLSVYRQFCAALDGQPSQVITGTEARQSLELANGLLLAGQSGKPVAFPLDRQQYAFFLAEQQQRASRLPFLVS
jgi:predicted dehydrogenase